MISSDLLEIGRKCKVFGVHSHLQTIENRLLRRKTEFVRKSQAPLQVV